MLTPKVAKPHLESREGKHNQFQRPFLTLPTFQIHSQEDSYQLQSENEVITRKI